MKYRISILLSAYIAMTSTFLSPVQAIEIPEESMFVPHEIGKTVTLSFKDSEFSAEVDGVTHRINSYDVSGLPKTLNEAELESFLNHGYLTLNQVGENYKIDAKVRLLGGIFGAKGGLFGNPKKAISSTIEKHIL